MPPRQGDNIFSLLVPSIKQERLVIDKPFLFDAISNPTKHFVVEPWLRLWVTYPTSCPTRHDDQM